VFSLRRAPKEKVKGIPFLRFPFWICNGLLESRSYSQLSYNICIWSHLSCLFIGSEFVPIVSCYSRSFNVFWLIREAAFFPFLCLRVSKSWEASFWVELSLLVRIKTLKWIPLGTYVVHDHGLTGFLAATEGYTSVPNSKRDLGLW